MTDALPITVILPTFNSMPFLQAQVASILDQTHPALTLMIRDDCSTDTTYRDLLATYGSSPRVQVSRNERHLGQTATIERLLEAVTTPLFAIADHDDVWAPTKIAESVEELLSSGAELCYTDLEVVDASLRALAPSALRFSRMPLVRGTRPLPILVKNPVHGCTVVAHRRLLSRALPLPTEVPDYDRWLALVAATGGGVAFLDRPLVRYRQHGSNSIGALPFTMKGLRRRLGDAAGRRLAQFAAERLSNRLLYLEALDRRVGLDHSLTRVRRHLRSGRLGRLARSPLYAALAATDAHEVPWRTRLADLALVTFARSPVQNTRHRILTLDETSLRDECERLAERVVADGFEPTHLVGIASAGVEVARRMAPSLPTDPEVVVIEARRPATTTVKRIRGAASVIRLLPRWATTALRHLGHLVAASRLAPVGRTVVMDDAQLERFPGDQAGARVLVVDDCVDTGRTLESCLGFLRARLAPGTEIRSAAICVSLRHPRVVPDVYLYDRTTVRGPWSLDG